MLSDFQFNTVRKNINYSCFTGLLDDLDQKK